ncbi:MAG: hypothetical protein GC162_20260 [Planctomycetes bacterium]|nr:hypothetical protein [Planctomycetota bacterium]
MTWTGRRERRDADTLCPVDQAGRVADFHALRHTFITKSGVAQGGGQDAGPSLDDHADDRPLHGTLVEDERAALDKLPTINSAALRVDAVANAIRTADIAPKRAPLMHQTGADVFPDASSSAILGRIEGGAVSASSDVQKPRENKATKKQRRPWCVIA